MHKRGCQTKALQQRECTPTPPGFPSHHFLCANTLQQGRRCAHNRRLSHPLYTRTGRDVGFAGQSAGRGNSLPGFVWPDYPGLVLKAESKKGRPQGCLNGSVQEGKMPRGHLQWVNSPWGNRSGCPELATLLPSVERRGSVHSAGAKRPTPVQPVSSDGSLRAQGSSHVW